MAIERLTVADIEANKAVARRYMQAVVDGDIATIEALQHPDCTWWILGFGDMTRADLIASVRDGLLTATVQWQAAKVKAPHVDRYRLDAASLPDHSRVSSVVGSIHLPGR